MPKTNGVIVDGIDTSSMTRSALEQFALLKKVELDRVREERHSSQVDRDKIATFWSISQNQLEEIKAEIRTRQRSVDEDREKSEALQQTQLQKIKFLIYEKESILATQKAEALVSREAALQEHIKQEAAIFDEKRKIKTDIVDTNLSTQEELRQLKTIQADELKKMKANFKQQINEIEIQLEKIRITTLAQLTIKHRTEINEIQERKNKQLAELIANNEKSFAELNNYYNDITVNNLGEDVEACLPVDDFHRRTRNVESHSHIALKIEFEIVKMKEQQEAANSVAAKAQTVTNNLRQPLEKAILENIELSRLTENHDKDKSALASKLKQIKEMGKQYEGMRLQCESLQRRFDVLEAERNELRTNLHVISEMILPEVSVPPVSAMKSSVSFTKYLGSLNQKAAGMTSNMETNIEMIENKEIAPTMIHSSLRMREIQVNDLHFEAACLRKAHDDVLATYEAKLIKFGIPLEELGFQRLKTVQIEGFNEPIIGHGPGGLVARNYFS